MLVAFIGKTETNEDITANNNINKFCSELQNAQMVDKKKKKTTRGYQMVKAEAAALLCCFTLSKHLTCTFKNTDVYSQPVKWKTN